VTTKNWRTDLLLAHLGPPMRDAVAAIPGLEGILAEQLEAGEEAWPQHAQPPERFLRYLADTALSRKLDDPDPITVAGMLAATHAADLYLACACASGDSRAIATFTERHADQIDAALRSAGATPAVVDETVQRLLELLFVAAPGGRRGIETYSGRGQLRAWVRSVAVRTGRRLMGADRAAVDPGVLELLPARDDPELEHLQERYGAELREAFHAALVALTPRQRNVLRQHHLDGLSIDQLAVLYRVHRATAARWAASARQALLDGTRDRLADRLALAPDDLDSIIRLVRSQLDVSLRRHLSDDPAPE
jgi:RNA polymerase sigma-70 factor (ECF subfamily)